MSFGFRKKRAAIITFVFVLVAAVFLYAVPRFYKGLLEARLTETCQACTLHIDDLTVNIFSSTMRAKGITFSADPKNSTVVKFALGELRLDVDVLKMLKKEWDIKKIRFIGLHVTIEEKHNPEEPKDDPVQLKNIEESYGGKILEKLPVVKIEGIEIDTSKLDYVLKIFNKDAHIIISDISARISSIATRKELSPRFTTAHLTGKLQESGIVTLNCKADLFSVKNDDDIEIKVEHQEMTKLNSFFSVEDGINLSGEIDEIASHFHLNQGHITGFMWGRYHDFSLEVKPTPEMGKLKATLINFFQKLKMAKTKPQDGKPIPKVAVDYKRKSHQGLINFLLQGLKEAAFKLASN